MALCRLFLFVFSIGFCTALHGGEPPLINIKTLAPGIVVEMRYASTDNFTGLKLYDAATCWLCEPAAHRLARVQKKLETVGLGLKLWDCYRPVSIQKKLWAVFPDSRYVADPKTGSRHNRGASIDLTLVDRAGNELPMPTGFDEFSPRAHRDFMDLPANILENRSRLTEAMESEGFVGLPTEWWHFDDPEWKNYALRDEPLSSTDLHIDQKTEVATFAIPNDSQQMVRVISPAWNSVTATLERFEKVADTWRRVGKPWPVVLGKNGLAWGQGLHNAQEGPQKREGDLKAPAGVFYLGTSYGYEPRPPAPSRWPYQPVHSAWRCVDDPTSASYNQILKIKEGEKPAWRSAEKMKRDDHLYKWVINVEQNFPLVMPGCGSCIFLHIWRRPASGTEGCTAMEEQHLVELLTWLDPAAKPLLVQLMADENRRLATRWKLPSPN